MSWASKHQPPKSRLVGPARQPNGQPTTAYEAIVPMTCGHCGVTIAPGELFARHTIPGRTQVPRLARVPVCTTCRPLQIVEHDGADGHG